MSGKPTSTSGTAGEQPAGLLPKRPKCPKGVPPSKLLSCSKFRPAGPEQPLTCALCGRSQKST